MKQSTLRYLPILAAFGLLTISCQKDSGSASVQGNATIQFKPQAVNTSSTIVGSTITPITAGTNTNGVATINWTSGYLNISEFEFEAQKENSSRQGDTSHIKYEIKGPFKLDLFAAPSILATLSLPSSIYNEVEVEIEGVKSANGDPNFYLEGTYKNEAGNISPIIIKLNEEYEIEAKFKQLQAQPINYVSLLKLQLDLLAKNIGTVNLSNATKTNGTIIISSTSNANIYQILVVNLSRMCDVEFK